MRTTVAVKIDQQRYELKHFLIIITCPLKHFLSVSAAYAVFSAKTT
jgi:hypothetical protein